MANYPDCVYMNEIVEKEMGKNLHILSGGNNEKLGYKKGDPYFTYESASRTILRLLWFLTLITHLFKNLRTYKDEPMDNIAKKSYNDSISSFHSPVLREAISTAFATVPTKKEFMQKNFGVTEFKAFSDILGNLLKPLAGFIARLWKYYQEKKLTTLE